MVYNIANRYAPNMTKEKIQLQESLEHELQTLDDNNPTVVGDFNIIINNSLNNISGFP